MTNTKRLHGMRGATRYIGAYISLHAAGGIYALMDEEGYTVQTELLEELLNEALRARHPEWYVEGYKHPFELAAEAKVAQEELEKMAKRLKEAEQAQRDAEEKARMARARAA